MKKIIISIGIYTMLLLTSVAIPQELSGKELSKKSEFKKKISKEFPISATGKINVTGKYGHLNVSTWEKNKAKFDVKIIVKANSKEKADKTFERININFSNGKDYAKALFEIKDGSWKDYKGVSYQIHYEIKIPAGCSVDLYNKYGNIHLTDIRGSAKIENKYGNIKTGDIGKEVNLQLGYGSANIGNIENLNAEIKYSKLDINSAKDIKIESKYSQIYVDKAHDIKSESKYDKFYLGDVNNIRSYGKYDNFKIKSLHNLDATGKYSDYDIKNLHGKIDLDMKYGDAVIHKTHSTYQGINFKGEYADLHVELAGVGSGFRLNGQYAKIKLPSSAKKKNYENERGAISTEGHIGSNNHTIKATLKYGSVVIFE
ncbi:MAG: hypothetical protein ACPG19_13335 [Saprospiraceae bacterium]